MKFIASLFFAASATAMELDTERDIPATSALGSRILSKSRMLEGNNQDYTSWVAGYSIKFDRCISSANYYGGYFANNQGGGNGDNADGYNDQQFQYDANAQWQNGEANVQANQQYDANAQYQQGANGQWQGQANGQDANGQYYNNGEQNAAYYQMAQDGENRKLEQNNQGYYYANQGENREQYQGMYQQRLVHFKLCPSDSCRSCTNGADYVVELNEFIDAMMEAKLTAQEYNCERVRENCWCENANNADYCLATCYTNAKMDYCNEMNGNNNYGQANGQFELSDALNCAQLDVDEDIMSNYYFQNRKSNQGHYNKEGKYYVGPYCSSNGKKIFLGLFEEETCSYPAPQGTFEALNYGSAMPYSKQSLIDSGCVSCKEPSEQNENNYWDNQDEDQVTDVCERVYEMSGKCEQNLQGLPYGTYPNNLGCDFVQNIRSASIIPQSVPAKTFAGIFAATTVLLAGMTVHLYQKSKRTNVALAGDIHPME